LTLCLAAPCSLHRSRDRVDSMKRVFRNRHINRLKCWACARTFETPMSKAKFCSEACRQFAYRMTKADRPWHYLFQPITVRLDAQPTQNPDGDSADINGLA
jgi:hypothetical protein